MELGEDKRLAQMVEKCTEGTQEDELSLAGKYPIIILFDSEKETPRK